MSFYGCQFDCKCNRSLNFYFLPLAWILLMHAISLTGSQGQKVRLSIQPEKETPWKALGYDDIYPKIFSCLIVFQFPDRNHTKEICLTSFVLFWFQNYCTFLETVSTHSTHMITHWKSNLGDNVRSWSYSTKISSVHLNSFKYACVYPLTNQALTLHSGLLGYFNNTNGTRDGDADGWHMLTSCPYIYSGSW